MPEKNAVVTMNLLQMSEAVRNLRCAFPELSPQEAQVVIEYRLEGDIEKLRKLLKACEHSLL